MSRKLPTGVKGGHAGVKFDDPQNMPFPQQKRWFTPLGVKGVILFKVSGGLVIGLCVAGAGSSFRGRAAASPGSFGPTDDPHNPKSGSQEVIRLAELGCIAMTPLRPP